MSSIKVSIGDKQFEIEQGSTLYQLIQTQIPHAKYQIVAAKIGDDVLELNQPLESDTQISWVPASSDEGLQIIRHSAAHIMATAVKKLFPNTKITIGPAVDNGFYYDFDSEHRFSEEDFVAIEAEVQRL